MSVLDDAIALEERAWKNYTEAGKKVSDPGGKKILGLLAGEERKHAEILEGMKSGTCSEPKRSPLLKEVHGLVEGAVENGQTKIFADASMRDILQQAMEIERTTERFYKEHAQATEDAKLRELFEYLAAREAEHYLLVSSLAEYFDRPVEWVESAEFGLRAEY